MFEQYSHLLIPDQAEFVPSPVSVAGTIESLVEKGGMPRDATFRLGVLDGHVRKGRDPLTGETIEMPMRNYRALNSASELLSALAGLDDYDLFLEGKGPASLPPFRLYNSANRKEFTEGYDYSVCFYLRKERLCLDAAQSHRHPPPEGRPATFRHPETSALIEVETSEYARFWIALGIGRWLVPKIGNSLVILNQALLETFSDGLGVTLVQGCSTY